MSLYERILAYYHRNDGRWISGGEVERLVAQRTKYKPSNCSRRLRELHEDGKLERKEVKRTVFYRYLPQKKQVIEPVFNGDGTVTLVAKEISA